MIVRKTVSIVSPSAQKCIDNFPPPLLLSIPRENGLVARKNWVSAFSESNHHRFSDSVPFSLWSATLSRIPLCLWPRSENDQCPAGNLFANRETSVELAIHSFSLSSIHHMMSLNIDMKIIRPWNCQVRPFCSWTLEFADKLQCSGSWEIFHSNSIGSPSIVSKVLYCDESLNQPQLLFPSSIWCWILIHLSKT